MTNICHIDLPCRLGAVQLLIQWKCILTQNRKVLQYIFNKKLKKEKGIKWEKRGGILQEKGQKRGVGLIFSLPQLVSVSLPIWLRADPALCWSLPLTRLVTCSAPSCYE